MATAAAIPITWQDQVIVSSKDVNDAMNTYLALPDFSYISLK